MSSQDPNDGKPIGRYAHLMSSIGAPKSSDDSAYTRKDSDDEPRSAVGGRGRLFAAMVRFLFYYVHRQTFE